MEFIPKTRLSLIGGVRMLCIDNFDVKSPISLIFSIKLVAAFSAAVYSNFVPDEFWQSTEVAYYQTFGEGHLTWEWHVGLRSYLFPYLIAQVYNVAKITQTVGLIMMVYVPFFLQGMLSLYATFCFRKYLLKVQGDTVGKISFFFLVTNWFATYCMVRPISNQIEMSLNMLGLYYLQNKFTETFTVVMVFNFFMRPTSAVFWIPYLPQFFKTFNTKQLVQSILTSLGVAVLLCWLDCQMYGRLVVTPWEFFKFNFLSGGSANFGVHNHLWYFYNGLPSAIGPLIILLPFGLFTSGSKRETGQIVFFIAVFSLIPHKEIRFLLPVLPLVCMVCGQVAYRFYKIMHKNEFFCRRETWPRICFAAASILCSISLAAVFLIGTYHQTGFASFASTYQYNTWEHREGKPLNVWIVTPCYSMPVYTYMRNPNVNYVYYICPPESYLHLYDFSNSSKYLYQAESFADQNLAADMSEKYAGHGAPDWLITYDHKAPIIQKTLKYLDSKTEYAVKHRFPHTLFPDQVWIAVLEKSSKN